MPKVKPWVRWTVLWRAENKRDGRVLRLQGENGDLPLFRSRQEARDFIEARYGYIRERKDLKKEPHGWKMPIPIKVVIAPIREPT